MGSSESTRPLLGLKRKCHFFCTLLQRNYIFFTNLPGKILFSQENDFQHILLFQNIKDWAHRESLAQSPTAGTYCSEYTCSAIFLFTSGSSKPSPCREHSFPNVLLSKTLKHTLQTYFYLSCGKPLHDFLKGPLKFLLFCTIHQCLLVALAKKCISCATACISRYRVFFPNWLRPKSSKQQIT